MIPLVQKQEIILKHFREGKSQRNIHREIDISRKTIRKFVMGLQAILTLKPSDA
nr:hypothetical protein [Alkaliphilus metalliredigens]